MPGPTFTNNPVEWTALEGLYISEQDPPGVVSGVDLSTVGIFGQTVRGPTGPVEISNISDFVNIFGGRDFGAGGDIVNEVWRALLNKPFGKIVVSRAVAAAAVASTVDLDDVNPTTIAVATASSLGAWGNSVNLTVEDATDGNVNHWNLRVEYLGQETVYENLDTTTGNDNLASTIGDSLSRIVDVTKSADGRPLNGASALATGSDGSIAASDYLAALALITEYKGISVIFNATETTATVATVNTQMVTDAAASSDRLYLIWSGDHTDDVATVVADVATFTRLDRVVYCYNSPYTLDPTTATQIRVPPVEWMASILSQNAVNVHPGEEATKKQTAGITKLTNPALTRVEYKSLKAAGICAFEKDDGFLFVSGVTTSLTSGKTEITRRRMTDFLQLSAADRLKYFVKKKNTTARRRQIKAELVSFSKSVQDSDGGAPALVIIDADGNNGLGAGFIVDNESVNTSETAGQGLHTILWRVRLIDHLLYIVLKTEIGTGVSISEA